MDEALEGVKAAYEELRRAKYENSIRILRLRADMAVAIENAHEAGYTNYKLAQMLNTDRTTIGRLQAAVWVPPGVGRGTTVPLTRPVEASKAPSPPSEYPVPAKRVARPLTPCRYCALQATHAIRFADGKVHYVCERHKPKERKKYGSEQAK